jgi:trans-2,3-dihydro-3-hydroxyanthranilate isomerase
MKNLPFTIVDVFAENKYAGNQLAVFRDAGGLSGEKMQAIARETHFSETAFILAEKPRDNGWDVRIFTPGEEVPFAGHPTLGTAHVIREEILKGKAGQVTLNLKAGRIPVALQAGGIGWMRQNEPAFGPTHPAPLLAAVLGLPEEGIDPRFPVEEVSTGLGFFIVPLRGLDVLRKAKIDRERYFSLVRATSTKGILVFCPQGRDTGEDLSVRVFVDWYGVPEDPATGSGNGCLAAWLVKHRFFAGAAIDLSCGQGHEIGRPSRLLLKAGEAQGRIRVSVGGRSITVARGEFI